GNVGDAGALHDGAHRTTGDHASARRRRLHEHLAGAMRSDDLVRNRSAGERHVHHLAARAVHGLADRFRDFVGLSGGKADLALPVAPGDERVEREAPAPFHALGDAVDGDHVPDEIAPSPATPPLVPPATTALTPPPATAAVPAAATLAATAA